MSEDILERIHAHFRGQTMYEGRKPTLLEEAAAEIKRLREKNRDLNRRCQIAESAVAEKVAKYPHSSLGRALANGAATMYRAQADDAVAEIESLRAKLAEAEKDRKRMDALEIAAREAPMQIEAYGTEVAIYWPEVSEGIHGDSLRDLIDGELAAMAEGEGEA